MSSTRFRESVFVFALAIPALTQASSASATEMEVWFSGNIVETNVSGTASADTNTLIGPDDSAFALVGISSKERSDEPCWVSTLSKSITDGGLVTRSRDRCGNRGPREGSRLTTSLPVSASPNFLSGVQVCMNRNNTKIKGWRVYSTAFILDENRLRSFESSAPIGGERRHCRHWKSVEKCPAGFAATSAELHYVDSGQRHSWSGIRLRCREVRRKTKFTLDDIGAGGGKRALSDPVSLTHRQPDGVEEMREFLYSTPNRFLHGEDRKFNLWLVLQGRGQQRHEMHGFFDEIPFSAPTILVYPLPLITDPFNAKHNTVDADRRINLKWRQPRIPVQAVQNDAFRDVVFLEHLVKKLLRRNPQLNPNRVFITGFSSGAGMSWTMLCYRSELFRGFAMYSQALKSGRQRGGCGDGSIATAADPRTGYERLTGQTPDRYGRQGAFSGVPPNAAFETKPVFYTHGTDDRNLTYGGNEIGCSDEGVETCQIPEDPKYSMDPGGDHEDHDDRSSVDWLLRRHGLSRVPGTVVPDERPKSGNDDVTTRSYLVQGASSAGNTGATILWYEMDGAAHSMSRIATGNDPSVSKDYDVSVHTQRFFEDHAGMLK